MQIQTKAWYIMAISAFLLAGAGCQPTAKVNVQTDAPGEQKDVMILEGSEGNQDSDIVEKKDDVVIKTDATVNTGVVVSPKPDATVKVDTKTDVQVKAARKGTYEAYEASKLALAKDGKVVLYFHAPWCPTCKTIDSDINANLGSIPDNTHILKVDYDSSTALKQKYGVTYQHTFVQVDAEGKLIKKWSGGLKLEDILLQI